MGIEKLDLKQASQLFTEQAKLQADSAKTVATLMQASLTDPSLAAVADALAEQVCKAAEAALAKIQGVPLEPTAIEAGKQAAGSVMDALRAMVGVREQYWKSYEQTTVPKTTTWVSSSELPGRLDEIAALLVRKAEHGPVGAKVNSKQIMLALPGDDANAVLERHKAARAVAESGSYLGEMHSQLMTRVSEAKGLASIAAAQGANPKGRNIDEIMAELDARVRAKHGDEAPAGAYVAAGLETLVHPEEIKRFVAFAAKDLQDKHDTSPLSFVGNMRYFLGHGMHVSGTEPHWKHALSTIQGG